VSRIAACAGGVKKRMQKQQTGRNGGEKGGEGNELRARTASGAYLLTQPSERKKKEEKSKTNKAGERKDPKIWPKTTGHKGGQGGARERKRRT